MWIRKPACVKRRGIHQGTVGGQSILYPRSVGIDLPGLFLLHDDEAIGLEQARIILGQVHAAAPTEISPKAGTGDTRRNLNLGATITISSAFSRKPVPLVITSATESP